MSEAEIENINTPESAASDDHRLVRHWFAAPQRYWDGGWWGPARSRDAAIADMQSNWNDDPLSECVTAEGFEVTMENYPELFEGEDSISEFQYQIEYDDVRTHSRL